MCRAGIQAFVPTLDTLPGTPLSNKHHFNILDSTHDNEACKCFKIKNVISFNNLLQTNLTKKVYYFKVCKYPLSTLLRRHPEGLSGM
jgi:hypothetical protein